MEEWKKVNIGDLCSTISETYRGDSDSVVLINTSDVLNGECLNHKFEPNKNLKGQFKKTFIPNDILYSEIRPANRRFAFVDFDSTNYIASTKLMVIRHNEKTIPLFLYHLLKSSFIVNQLQALAETRSGTFPQITFTELSAIEVMLPPMDEQKRIVETLSSIENKIAINRRINDNLKSN